MKIGYVGLGAMGASLAGHLIADHDVSVFDLNRDAMEAMGARGAKLAQSLEELARNCDVIVMCLPRTSDVHVALFGPNGLARFLRAGMLIIDQTSGRPLETASMAAQLKNRGVDFVDAPLSGGIPAARSRRVTIIASGAEDALKRAWPILESMSCTVINCSDRVGDAQAMKLINNAMGASYRMATLELIALGCKIGIPLRHMVMLLGEGPAASFTTRHMLPARLEGKATTDFALALMTKDMNEAVALGLHVGAPMPIAGIVRCMMQCGLNTIGHDARLESVFDLVEKLSGTTLDKPQSMLTGEELDKTGHHIVIAAAACNRLAVMECTAAGLAFGLSSTRINEILNVGSAWSRASEEILPCLAADKPMPASESLGTIADSLKVVAELSAATTVPLFVVNSVRAIYEAAKQEFGHEVGLDELWAVSARGAGVARSH